MLSSKALCRSFHKDLNIFGMLSNFRDIWKIIRHLEKLGMVIFRNIHSLFVWAAGADLEGPGGLVESPKLKRKKKLRRNDTRAHHPALRRPEIPFPRTSILRTVPGDDASLPRSGLQGLLRPLKEQEEPWVFLTTFSNLCQKQPTSAVSDYRYPDYRYSIRHSRTPQMSDSKTTDAGNIAGSESSSSVPSTIARKFGNIWPKWFKISIFLKQK